ncbi:MAG: hypothetical protein PHT24_08125 [Endomicrobiaceae bacterium]|jgi:hypothetical protein|nr:hypothetical protein [Endomicrobiaceae bacterium]
MINDFIIIESHYGVSENLIRAETRNKCSENFIEIINELANILYPSEEFEIYLLPSQEGSYKDIIKFVKKAKKETSKSMSTLLLIGNLTVGYLVYSNSNHEFQLHKDAQTVDMANKCISLQQQIELLKDQYEIDNFQDQKVNEICGNLKLKKLKNEIYETLNEDDMIASDELIVKDMDENTIVQEKVERRDFENHIEYIPENEGYLKQNSEGIIELITLVLRQKRDGKGIPWRGIYYGADIKAGNIDILKNGEEITFYMQDQIFKRKIDGQEITFSSGDNIKVVFDIKGMINIDKIQYKNIYIKTVESFNESEIVHPKKTNAGGAASEDQLSLF